MLSIDHAIFKFLAHREEVDTTTDYLVRHQTTGQEIFDAVFSLAHEITFVANRLQEFWSIITLLCLVERYLMLAQLEVKRSLNGKDIFPIWHESVINHVLLVIHLEVIFQTAANSIILS